MINLMKNRGVEGGGGWGVNISSIIYEVSTTNLNFLRKRVATQKTQNK